LTISEQSTADHLVVLRLTETGPEDFIKFWASQYVDPREALYDENIGKPLTPGSVMALFEWKNGGKLSARKRLSVQEHYVPRIDKPLAGEVRGFLNSFGPSKGGAIWPIFWLHCCNQQFPIFDQHAYRAMIFIEHDQSDELDKYSDKQKIDLYLDGYIPFRLRFGRADRRTDQAFWMFGKFLKTKPNYL